MNDSPYKHIYKFRVNALTSDRRADELRQLLAAYHIVKRVDINVASRVMRIITEEEINLKKLSVKLAARRFHLERLPLSPEYYQQARLATDANYASPRTMQSNHGAFHVGIQGMTCHSCELTIERKLKKLSGVSQVEVNAGTGRARIQIHGPRPSLEDLQNALGNGKYRVYAASHNGQNQSAAPSAVPEGRPSLARLVGLIASVLFIGYLLSKLGLFGANISFGSKMSFGTVFIIGLVAAASSCIAVTGGLLLSSMARFNQQYQASSRLGRLRPVLMFVTGRVLGYGFFGGLLGVIGKAIVPSPFLTGFLIIVAAFYMFVMGMEMLHIAPAWLKRLLPRMPKALSHRIMDQESHRSPLAPFFLGAGTFFLPCGFTQALQLYALTTGSFGAAGLTLLAFALGTAPSLLALGWASGSLKGKAGKLFFQFSGTLVMVLGVWNFQNGMNLIGYPLPWGSNGTPGAAEESSVSAGEVDDSSDTIPLEGGVEQDVQVVKMKVGGGGYSPSRLTVRAGTLVRWEVDGTNAQGCISVLVSRQLGIQEYLKPGKNVFEFTPKKAGDISFSCSMGMYRGSFKVLPPS